MKEKVEEIVGGIISDGMTDSEKCHAINSYLCDNSYYDNDALENAEKYSFTQVDESFYDSFTAYGILIDGVGVCASYSAAFKLLADAAGLDSIVVTGYLDGSVPHAWNKVKLEENWYIVDSTNNDNEMIQNAFHVLIVLIFVPMLHFLLFLVLLLLLFLYNSGFEYIAPLALLFLLSALQILLVTPQ